MVVSICALGRADRQWYAALRMALIKHRKEWSIDKHRVAVDLSGMVVTVRIDGGAEPVLAVSSRLLGSHSFEVGPRIAELRRVRTLDVVRSELWIEGIKVPPTREPIALRKAAEGAHCQQHAARSERGPSSSGYREPALAPLAKIECGVCHAPICAEHRAVDGVRCTDCFARDAEELQKLEHAVRVKGILIGLALVGAIALIGVATHSPKVIVGAVGAGLVGLFSGVRGLLKERGVLRERQATRAELESVRRPSGRQPSRTLAK